ncbi:uncharacterized protein LOC141853603 [Brevipalpus obovatus]|uniref:uncharacterized protein LOC141853603 n=1 Tax=Brevipalpus obovatus TaxID=246614 RepID=UPI003D9E6459
MGPYKRLSKEEKEERKRLKREKKVAKEKTIPLQNTTVESVDFLHDYCASPSFEDDFWFHDAGKIQLLDRKTASKYLPPVSGSVKFTFSAAEEQKYGFSPSGHEIQWIELQLFETIENHKKSITTGYIGSESHSMEWLPLPWHWNPKKFTNSSHKISTICENDYILIASLSECCAFKDYERSNYVHKSTVEEESNSGLLQLWKFNNQSSKLSIACCFAHDYGQVWCMEACKGGTSFCYEKNRLSLVATAFDDGFIRIFSIPLPDSLLKDSKSKTKVPIYRLPPVAVLLPPHDEHIVCKSLSWSWCDNQAFIAAGYGTGFISLFDLGSEASLLARAHPKEKTRLVESSRAWFAHGAMVSAIRILPIDGSNIIVSGGYDRNIKLWCTSDAKLLPITVLHRSVVNCLESSFHWPTGFFLSLDDCFLTKNQSIVSFKQLLLEGQNSLSETKSLFSMPYSALDTTNVHSLSLSFFYNSLIAADDSGNVVLHNNFRGKHEKSNRKRLTDLLPIFLTHLANLSPEVGRQVDTKVNAPAAAEARASSSSSSEPQTGSKDDNIDTGSSSISNYEGDDGFLIAKSRPRLRNYEQIVSSYGLIFNDFHLDLEDPKVTSCLTQFQVKPNMRKKRLTDYPLSAVNKVLWSPNKRSSSSLAILMHCGLLRIVSKLPSSCCCGNLREVTVEEEGEKVGDEDEGNELTSISASFPTSSSSMRSRRRKSPPPPPPLQAEKVDQRPRRRGHRS